MYLKINRPQLGRRASPRPTDANDDDDGDAQSSDEGAQSEDSGDEE